MFYIFRINANNNSARCCCEGFLSSSSSLDIYEKQTRVALLLPYSRRGIACAVKAYIPAEKEEKNGIILATEQSALL